MAGPLRVVSGGQTGVDRAALDAALAAGVSCGGWCPAGRWAEDGVIAERYPLSETPEKYPEERTQRNVRDSDGTLVFEFQAASPGTRLTVELARAMQRPVLTLHALSNTHESAIATVLTFVQTHRISTINVAGPRALEAPEAYDYTRKVMAGVFRALTQA